MQKTQLNPDTTLYPVPVVLITCGVGDKINVFSLNRIASCNAEPPMLSISVRPMRASHDLIEQSGEFVVNIPWPELELVSDFVGTTTMRETDKWWETGLTPLPATHTHGPLIAECPVNIDQLGAIVDLRRHLVGEGEIRGGAENCNGYQCRSRYPARPPRGPLEPAQWPGSYVPA